MTTITVNSGDNLQTAIDDATAGDVLDIRAGTYTGVTVPTGRPATSKVCFKVEKQLTFQRHSGDAMPRITYDPANPPYDTLNTCYGSVFYIGGPSGVDGAVFDGLEIVGMNALGAPASVANNVCLNFNGAGLAHIVRNCLIRDGNFGVLMESPGGLIEKNEVRYMGQVNPDSRLHGIYGDVGDGMVIRNNYVHHCTGYGIHDYSAPLNHKIYGNIVVHNGGGLLVTGDGHSIYGNTIAWNEGGGLVPNDGTRIGVIGYSTNTLFKNNIVWGNGLPAGVSRNYGDFQWDNSNVSLTEDHNLIGTYSFWYSAGYHADDSWLDASDLRVNPLFVNGSPQDWLDFRTASNSPCKGAGASLSAEFNQAIDPASTDWPPAFVTQT